MIFCSIEFSYPPLGIAIWLKVEYFIGFLFLYIAFNIMDTSLDTIWFGYILDVFKIHFQDFTSYIWPFLSQRWKSKIKSLKIGYARFYARKCTANLLYLCSMSESYSPGGCSSVLEEAASSGYYCQNRLLLTTLLLLLVLQFWFIHVQPFKRVRPWLLLNNDVLWRFWYCLVRNIR